MRRKPKKINQCALNRAQRLIPGTPEADSGTSATDKHLSSEEPSKPIFSHSAHKDSRLTVLKRFFGAVSAHKHSRFFYEKILCLSSSTAELRRDSEFSLGTNLHPPSRITTYARQLESSPRRQPREYSLTLRRIMRSLPGQSAHKHSRFLCVKIL